MALIKEIELENGVVLKYHRITSLNKITNQSNTIEVNSYISESQREKEQEYQEKQKQFGQLRDELENNKLTEEEQENIQKQYDDLEKDLEKGINVLIETNYISIPYDEEMTIEDAYDYLKMTDKYKDGKNA